MNNKSTLIGAGILLMASAAFAESPADPLKQRISRPADFTSYGGLVQTIAGPTDEARAADPLKHLAADMSEISEDLEALKTGKPVQVKEEKVVTRLEELIAMLEKQCSGSGSGGANPTRPMQDSNIAGGPGGGELHASKAGDKEWGKLPAKQREQILQSRTEGFPAGYETILQSYYQRLAQEKVADDALASGPTTRPAAR